MQIHRIFLKTARYNQMSDNWLTQVHPLNKFTTSWNRIETEFCELKLKLQLQTCYMDSKSVFQSPCEINSADQKQKRFTKRRETPGTPGISQIRLHTNGPWKKQAEYILSVA